jgi:hypothetical protein
VRSDSAGGTSVFVLWPAGTRHRIPGRRPRKAAVSAAITTANEDPSRWETALEQDRTDPDATSSAKTAAVCEVTNLADLSEWPNRTRLIIPPPADGSCHPDDAAAGSGVPVLGPLHRLGRPPGELDRMMLATPMSKTTLGGRRTPGLERFPCTDFAANQERLQTVL